jgi:hypothetical protein
MTKRRDSCALHLARLGGLMSPIGALQTSGGEQVQGGDAYSHTPS